MIFALLFAQAPAILQVVPNNIPDSPQRRTWESVEYKCDMIEEDGTRSKLVLTRSGGRGFRNPVSGEISTTEVRIGSSGSGATRFAGYVLSDNGDNRIDAIPANRSHDVPSLRIGLAEAMSSWKNHSRSKFSILIQSSYPWPELSLATGFCKASFHRQEPLSEAEALRYNSK
jgi:hypothetical protein